MNITELCSLIYEDLNARIETVRRIEYSISIDVCFDDPKEDRIRKVTIDCDMVSEAKITPTHFEYLTQTHNHPLLLDHTDDFGYLSFSSAPKSPEEVIGRLYEAHYSIVSDWRSISGYLNHIPKEGICGLLKGGLGMIARGPFSLLRSYESAVSELLQISLVKKTRDHRRLLSVLIFDSEYVIAESFTCNEKT